MLHFTVSSLSHLNPIYMLIPHLFNVCHNNTHFYTRRRPRISLSGFPTKVVVCWYFSMSQLVLLAPPIACCSLHYLVKSANREACCCAAFSVIIVRDGRFKSAYFPQHLVIRLSQSVFFFSFRVEEQVPRVYQLTEEMNLNIFK